MIRTNTLHIVRVFEHQEIRLGDSLTDAVVVTEELLQHFAAIQSSPLGKCFQVSPESVRFKQFVGILQLGPYLIEILPKLDQEARAEQVQWADFLIDLLRETQELPLLSSGQAQQSMSNSYLADLLAESLLHHLQIIVRQGLLQQYATLPHRDKQPRGPIYWPRQMRSRPHLPPILEQHIRKRQHDHMYNGWLAAAIQYLQKWPLRAEWHHQLRRLAAIFPQPIWPDPIALRGMHHPSGAIGRAYRPALQIAMHLFRAQGNRLRAGQLAAPGILFDMNALFESYIFRQLQKHLPKGAIITRQQSRIFWRRLQLRPDILLDLDGNQYIMDTKWKQLATNSPSAEDLRQLYVYQRVFGARRGVLIYPRADAVDWQAAHPYQSIVAEPVVYDARLLFASILTEGRLNRNLGAEIIAGLLQA